MGFLDINLDDVQEPTVVDANSEVQVRVTGASTGDDKNGNPYILIRLDIPEEPTAKDFTYFLGLPNSSMDAKKLNNTKWKLKMFFDAIDEDPSGLDSADDLVGKTFWAILGVSESDEYGEQNYVKKIVKGA